jgi:histidinol-phosphate/aromatic aminotransferase/cobyric acid decarboxylase-like protein
LLKRGIVVRAIPGVNGLRVGVGDREGIEATTTAFKELFGA